MRRMLNLLWPLARCQGATERPYAMAQGHRRRRCGFWRDLPIDGLSRAYKCQRSVATCCWHGVHITGQVVANMVSLIRVGVIMRSPI